MEIEKIQVKVGQTDRSFVPR